MGAPPLDFLRRTPSGRARPLLMAGHRQVISRISKGNQNILILYNSIITTFDCQGGSQGGGISAGVFALARPGLAPPLRTPSNHSCLVLYGFTCMLHCIV